MFYEDYWGEDSKGQEMAKEYQLPDPRPFLGSTAKSPNTIFAFESKGTFYMWSAVVDSVSQVTKPKTEEEIIETIVNGASLNLALKEIKPPKK